MKKLSIFLVGLCIAIFSMFSAQTYQLTGNPINTTGWTIVPSAAANTDFIALTPDVTNSSGAIKLNDQMNLKFCDKWRIEFDFRVDGSNSSPAYYGDGFAFWYLANPPITSQQGSGLGIPQNATGLMVGFDLYNNTTAGQMNKVHVAYGVVQNTTDSNNIEYFNTAGSSYHSADLTSTPQSFIGSTYRHVEVTGQVNPAAPASWIITIKINGTQIVSQSFAPAGAAAAMTTGYFGFSASTGAAKARHSIQNVKIYVDKVPTLTNTVTPSKYCLNPLTNQATADLTAFNSTFVTNPSNYTFSYVVGSTVISNPTNYVFNANTTVKVIIKDNAGILCDNPDGVINLQIADPVPFFNKELYTCPLENNTGIYDLTSSVVTMVTPVTKKYYTSLANLTNDTNEITNPTAYVGTAGSKIYVKVINAAGCFAVATITLKFNDVPIVNDSSMEVCPIEDNPINGQFNLSLPVVTVTPGIVKSFHLSLADATSNSNPIATPLAYIAPNSVVYVRVANMEGCFKVAKITLKVKPQKLSQTLQDQIICVENLTSLDAGPGFSSYTWSNGATTQSITNIGVGAYWVRMKYGDCFVTQNVKVLPADPPVIKDVKLESNKATVNAVGGQPPYKYSLDGIMWQDSNVFSNLKRGEQEFFVKDSRNCEPANTVVTIPYIMNAITPNGDGHNDFIDYSALRNKKNLIFAVYDRYGNQVFKGEKFNNYIWNGQAYDKKLQSGTYWYTLTWNENDTKSTPVQYDGWIMVKNRD